MTLRTRFRYSVFQPLLSKAYTLPFAACIPCWSLAPNITTAAPGCSAFT